MISHSTASIPQHSLCQVSPSQKQPSLHNQGCSISEESISRKLVIMSRGWLIKSSKWSLWVSIPSPSFVWFCKTPAHTLLMHTCMRNGSNIAWSVFRAVECGAVREVFVKVAEPWRLVNFRKGRFRMRRHVGQDTEVHGESISGPTWSLSWAGIWGYGVKYRKIETRPKELNPWSGSSFLFRCCWVEKKGFECARQVLYPWAAFQTHSSKHCSCIW